MTNQDDGVFSPDHPVRMWLTDLDGSPIGWFTGRVGEVSELMEDIRLARKDREEFQSKVVAALAA
jgi:hypothetical protein